VGAGAVAGGKKNARRQRAWLVFEDESGLSQQPVVRRTWAPRGQTPVLTHVLNSWKRLSVAAVLAFRWDGRRTRLYFQTRPGTYTTATLVPFLRALKRHFRGHRIILLWDGLGAHTSRRMRAYVAAARLAEGRALARLRARLEPRRAIVGQREDARAGESLRARSGRARPATAGRSRPDPSAPHAGVQLPASCGTDPMNITIFREAL
jgi:hypothetical protein